MEVRNTVLDGSRRTARWLLACGASAGPLYVVVGVVEALVRPGFDPLRHDLSLLANGEWGWVHVALLILTGVLTIAGAAGARAALRGGKGGAWGPVLLAIYGFGLVGAGIFRADPVNGFPPGTPGVPGTMSTHGMLHLVCGGLGFLAFVACSMVFARRFASQARPGWTAWSIVTGIFFLASFMGIAAGSRQSGSALVIVTMIFTAAVILAWSWISATSRRLVADLAGGTT
jgi:hypothetical protein